MACDSLAHRAREVLFRWMDDGTLLTFQFVVPAYTEILNKIQEDPTGFDVQVLPWCEAASRGLSLRSFFYEAVSARLPLHEAASARLPLRGRLLRGCLFEVVFVRIGNPCTKYGSQGAAWQPDLPD